MKKSPTAAPAGKKLDVRKLLFRVGAIAICVALAVVMTIIGRGHTVYIDNKTVEYNGQEYKAFYRVEVTTHRMDKTAKLDARDRGMSKWIGQSFRMELTITETKDSDPVSKAVSLSLPYSIDNPIINLPALLNGLPQEAWLDEFIPAPPADEDEPLDVGLGDGGVELEGTGESDLPDIME